MAVGTPPQYMQRKSQLVPLSSFLLWWNAVDSAVDTVSVVIDVGGRKLLFGVEPIPEQYLVQQFAVCRLISSRSGVKSRVCRRPFSPESWFSAILFRVRRLVASITTPSCQCPVML